MLVCGEGTGEGGIGNANLICECKMMSITSNMSREAEEDTVYEMTVTEESRLLSQLEIEKLRVLSIRSAVEVTSTSTWKNAFMVEPTKV